MLSLTQNGATITGTVTVLSFQASTEYPVSGTYHPPRIQLSSEPQPGLGQSFNEVTLNGTAVSSTVIELAIDSAPPTRFVKQ